MPGIYGCFGCSNEEESHLQYEFCQPWGKCEHTSFTGGAIGGHAFSKKSSLHKSENGIILAVDGEISIYRMAEQLCHENAVVFDDISSLNNEIRGLKGNLVVVDKISGSCHIVSEWTGTFPLYYAHLNDKFIFCSRQKPLAQVFDLHPDYVGIIEYFRYTFMCAGRTFFSGLRRLLPGQILSFYRPSNELIIRESSLLWAPREQNLNTADYCEVLLGKLKKSLEKCFGLDPSIGLMISGGWDSRLLLASLLKFVNFKKLTTYVHGDTGSRELNIVKKMCQSENIQCILDDINEEIFSTTFLQQKFNRTEEILFPYWHRAGERLVSQGLDCVTAGVYGEILGGHYSSAMLLSGLKKISAVGSHLLEKPTQSINLRNHFGLKELKKPWYLKSDFWKDFNNSINVINEDLEVSIKRLMARGIKNPENLVEAFIAEHRATQYINSQILSCRASLDIALPFCDNELLDFSWQIPMGKRIHNTLNRELLQRLAPHLLNFPTGAILVPARFPIFIQEASRACRVIFQDSQNFLNWATAGRVKSPRWGWLNYEFLRTSSAFKNILEDLKCDFWDREVIAQAIKTPDNFSNDINTMNNILSGMLKIYSIDLMLRK